VIHIGLYSLQFLLQVLDLMINLTHVRTQQLLFDRAVVPLLLLRLPSIY
jgi:hypothetical protein